MNSNLKGTFQERKLDTKNRNRVKFCPCGKDNKDCKFVPDEGYDNEGYCHGCNTFIRFIHPHAEHTYSQSITHNTPMTNSYIHHSILMECLDNYPESNFSKFLTERFGEKITIQVTAKYFLGASNYWSGATVFPQIDIEGNIRTGKIILYDPYSCKRVKEPFNHIQWLHNFPIQDNFELRQCFFGEHILSSNPQNRLIAITESEKTAVIASIYYPEYIWLGAGGKAGLTREKCRVLKGQTILLFPDVSKSNDKVKAFDLWSAKAKEFTDIATFYISDLLERKATFDERENGLDIADYLLQHDHKAFLQFSSLL